LGRQASGDILDAYSRSQHPSIMRFTVFSIKDNFPKFLRVDGFCLDPLNSRDARSALDWLLYGIDHQDIYPFRVLTASNFYGYTNYIEGGQPVTRDQFLRDLETRLDSSNVSCSGFSGADPSIQVWTTGWSPPWEITEFCYIDCESQNPPYRNSSTGFFLNEIDGEWKLTVNYINDPQGFYFTDHDLISCKQPERLALDSVTQSGGQSASSCPGAPAQRVSVGEAGYVCTQTDNVRVRNAPNRSADVIASLPPGTTFTILDGPACSDDWSWWRVRTSQGEQGWIAEGGDNVDAYFICPWP
jgi:hypothetical protein